VPALLHGCTACDGGRLARLLTPFTDVQDIYIARAEGELALEEELYWCVFTICCLMLLLLLLLTLTLALLLTLCPTSLRQCNVYCCRALISVYRQPNIMFELTKKND
jgi:hypothetical protein